MKLSLVLPSFLAAAAFVGAEKAPATSGGLRANANQGERKTNAVTPDYWVAPIKNIGLKCIDNSIRAGGGKPNDICITEGEALCIQYDYKPMGGRWQFGIKDSKLRLYDPKQQVAYEYGTDVSHVCIGEEHGFDPNRYSKERPYMTFYNEKTHKVVGSLKCDGTDGKDDENLGQSTMLKLVDQADIGPYATYPLTIVKFKKGQTPDPEDDNSLWNIVVGDYPTDQPTLAPTKEPTFFPTLMASSFGSVDSSSFGSVDSSSFGSVDSSSFGSVDSSSFGSVDSSSFGSVDSSEPTDAPTAEPTDAPTEEPTFEPTEALSALYGLINFNADKCEWIAFVDTFQELQRRIAMATDPNNPAKIEISNIRPIVFEDIIDISNKYFEISCPDSDCVFDLNGYSFVTPDNENGSPFQVEFDGMMIKNGYTRKGRDDDTYDSDNGGAFLLYGVSPDVSSLVLTNSILRENFAKGDAGVIGNSGASITAIDCIFENNESEDGLGGVMYSEGIITLARCRFDGNSAFAGNGGALYFTGDSRGTITDCEFIDNISEFIDNTSYIDDESENGKGGGVMYSEGHVTLQRCRFDGNSAEGNGGALYFTDDSRATITDCIFENNESEYGLGGVMYSEGIITLARCRFDGNSADDNGGALYFTGDSRATITDCEFDGNFATFLGGALFFDEGSRATITDCEFDGNFAESSGGALFFDEGSRATITDCEFHDNICNGDEGAIFSEGNGGAIYSKGNSLVLEGCIFTRNEAETGGAIFTAAERSEVRACSFEENEADYGGAIYKEDGSIEIAGTTFGCNEAYDYGGAIFSDYGDIELSESDFTSNSAPVGGGALYFFAVTDVHISGCLFDGNKADGEYEWQGRGGAISHFANPSTFIIEDTVFQNNTSMNYYGFSDIFYDDFFSEFDIECGSGFGNCFCDADASPGVMEISTNYPNTTCSGAGKGPACSGCRPSVPASCSTI